MSIVQAEEPMPVEEFPDERLKLLFVCAHPAIDPDVHTALMLQTVLGLDAARVARAMSATATDSACSAEAAWSCAARCERSLAVVA